MDSSNNNYSTFYRTFLMLNTFPIGNFYFIGYSNSDAQFLSNMKLFHNTLHIILSFITNIMIVSILIAILSGIYEEIKEQSSK
jgi:hypothetical protein